MVTDDAANTSPSFTSVPVTTALQGQVYNYDADAIDPDAGDMLTYSLIIAPVDMTIDPVSGLISWSPDAGDVGNHPVQIMVEDLAASSASQNYDLLVN